MPNTSNTSSRRFIFYAVGISMPRAGSCCQRQSSLAVVVGSRLRQSSLPIRPRCARSTSTNDRAESSSTSKTSTPQLAMCGLGGFPHRLLLGFKITWDQAFPSEGLLAAGKNANQGQRDTRQRGVLRASGTVHPGVPIVHVCSPRANGPKLLKT